MPLVRIDIRKDRPAGLGRRIGEVVYRTMADTINVPANDNFQVIAEHDADRLVYDPEYLGIARSDGIVFIQVTLNEGRSVELKKRFYETLASYTTCTRCWARWGRPWKCRCTCGRIA